jgi:hypothetical protein
VETAGNFIAAPAELRAGVEHGHGDFDAGFLFLRVKINREAPAVVFDRDGTVFIENAVYFGAVAGEDLVNAVVGYLDKEMLETPGAGGADIHSRPLADGIQALENLDVFGLVLCCSWG